MHQGGIDMSAKSGVGNSTSRTSIRLTMPSDKGEYGYQEANSRDGSSTHGELGGLDDGADITNQT